MDPVETLRELRELAALVLSPDWTSDAADDAVHFAELVNALDGWMQMGGYSPWQAETERMRREQLAADARALDYAEQREREREEGEPMSVKNGPVQADLPPTPAALVKLKSPAGTWIVGTLELIQGRADVLGFERKEDGTWQAEYAGGTEVFWDEQRTKLAEDGSPLCLDEDGDEWPLSQCVEAPDDEEAP